MIAFFLSATKEAGITISKYVKTPSIPKAPASRRASRAADDDDEDDEELIEARTPPANSIPGLDAAFVALLTKLPASGDVMSSKDRELFLNAFSALMNVVYRTE